MEVRGGMKGQCISCEEVISKLKDDGDFDKLRLKVIRKLKENEELRNTVMSIVRQSAALNRPGFENMKPRQQCDAIHQEVGDKLMGKISDAVWKVIRSGDGMENEIKDTVQSVYYRLLKPQLNGGGESSSSHVQSQTLQTGFATVSSGDTQLTALDDEPNAPPGFVLNNLAQSSENKQKELTNDVKGPYILDPGKHKEQEDKHCTEDIVEPDEMDTSAPPGFSIVLKRKKLSDASDEEPDVPPGFG